MKKLLFATAAVFCLTFCNAQNLKKSTQKPISNTAVQTDLSKKVSSAKVVNGNVKIYTEPGKYDVYVTYKNSKVADFYAIDTKGNKIPATYKEKGKSSSKMKCTFCIVNELGDVCYEVDCKNIPDPIKDAGYKQ